MALFSLFGKKSSQPDEVVEEKNAQEPSIADEAVQKQAESMRMRRDAARKTAEKIDAIESEIARDILKNPVKKGAESPAPKGQPEADPEGDYPSSNLFHTTLIRVDRETMILFKEDMDE